MNPHTRSASLKKIHQFLQSLVDGHFLFFFPNATIHFLDLLSTKSFCC